MIHGVQALWGKNLTTEDWGFFLVDAKKAFNEINRVGIMWKVRHLWMSVAHVVFNCYCKWSLFVLRNRNRKSSFLHSKEGVTQGCPLAMITSRIVVLPLIKNIKWEIPNITHTWYGDNTGASGTFTIIETYFNFLTCQGPGRGYYPKPSKSVLFVHPVNLETGKEFGARQVFKVCTGALYPGSYIRDGESKSDWLRERTLTCEKNINKISETEGGYPQESYAAVVSAIQSEWIFLQHVTWDTGYVFTGSGKKIQETFLPRLFFRNTKTLSPFVGSISAMPAKKSGLGLLNPVT